MSKSGKGSLIVANNKAAQGETAQLVETAVGLRPKTVTVPLSLMEPWYMMDKPELIGRLQADWGDRAVLIENKVGYLLWIKCSDDPPPFLLVHHIDTVQAHSSATFVTYRHNGHLYIHSPHNDDRLGVATAMATLPANGVTNYDILITDMEEVGNTTARDFMAWVNDKELGPEPDEKDRIENYRAILEFDRGGDDWVTYDSHNKAGYDYLVTGLGWRQGRGSFSDVKALQGLGVFTINFGTGYQNPHSLTGYASVEVYAWCVANAISFMRHFGAEGMGKLLHEPRAETQTTWTNNSRPASTQNNGAQTPPSGAPWHSGLAKVRGLVNSTVDKMVVASKNLMLTNVTGDYVQVPDVGIRLLSVINVDRPKENTNCGVCGSKTATMGEMQYTYNVAVMPGGDTKVKIATIPMILCEPCMQTHRDRRVTCANDHKRSSIFMAPPTPLGIVVPGDRCFLFCECHSPYLNGQEAHKLTSIRLTVKGQTAPLMVPRTYSELLRFVEQNKDMEVGSYYCDASETTYPLVSTPGGDGRWWTRLLWGEGPYLGIVSAVEMKKKYGDTFYTDWYAIASNPNVTAEEYLMAIGEIQRIYEGLLKEEEE